jgi:hypothetical protein
MFLSHRRTAWGGIHPVAIQVRVSANAGTPSLTQNVLPHQNDNPLSGLDRSHPSDVASDPGRFPRQELSFRGVDRTRKSRPRDPMGDSILQKEKHDALVARTGLLPACGVGANERRLPISRSR